MPIYEYWCDSCQRRVSLYQREVSSPPPPCPYCQNIGLKRIFSTFSVQKTYKDIYDDILSDHQLTQAMMRNDPRALAEWNRRLTQGEKTAPEYEEITERMEKGQWPAEQIEEKRKELFAGEESKPAESE